MRFFFLPLLFCLLGSTGINYAQADTASSGSLPLEMGLGTAVESLPVFPGCEGTAENEILDCFDLQLARFLGMHLSYPKRSMEMGQEGVVYVKFVIDSDGFVSGVEQVQRGAAAPRDMVEESLRVIRLLPRMQPARMKGEAIPVKYVIPISFNINNGGKTIVNRRGRR